MDDSLLAVVAGVCGLLVGAGVVFAWRYSERQQRSVPPQPEPAVPPGVHAVLTVLRSSAVLVDSGDRVLQASAPAHALGLLRGDRLAPADLQDLVRQVRRDGEVREAEIVLEHPARRSALPLHVAARVAPLSSQLMLVLVEDRTRERHVEAIRKDFVANVSHELKTPVGALNLLAEAVTEARDDPEAVQRFATRMQREGDRLSRLVQQIIELSRLQGDALVDEPAEVSVADVVAAALEASATDAETKGIELAAVPVVPAPAGSAAPAAAHAAGEDTGDEPLAVLGDPDQIRVAVGNLVENAVTYGPEGSRVTVTAKRVDQSVHITVADQGPGIPDAEVERIFERFYRVDPARARATGGTGLGLSIVKHVAASHGGTVEVWSEPGQGSSFTLVLPAHAGTAEPPAVAVDGARGHGSDEYGPVGPGAPGTGDGLRSVGEQPVEGRTRA